MERGFAGSLAARVIIFGLAAVAVFYMLPSSGASQFQKMNAALQNARSWRARTEIHEPTRNQESTVEVYCPSRVHTVSKFRVDDGATHVQEESEEIWIEGAVYARKGFHWVLTHDQRMNTAVCAWGPRGSDTFLAQMDGITHIGKIRKGERRFVGDTHCRDWIASVPAPSGWRDSFVVCIGPDSLPREVFSPDRSTVITCSDWNAPVRVEAPGPDDSVIY